MQEKTQESGLAKLKRLAALALALYEKSKVCRHGREPRLFAAACDRMPDEPSRLLREVAYEATGRGPGSLFRRGIVSALYEDRAYDIVVSKSISAYWFWLLTACAAEHAKSLPLSVSDVEAAIADVRARTVVDGVGSAEALSQPLGKYTLGELSALLEAGVLFIDVETTGACACERKTHELVKKNPLFLGFDELFYHAGESLRSEQLSGQPALPAVNCD